MNRAEASRGANRQPALSKNLLEMKFMQRSKQKLEKEAESNMCKSVANAYLPTSAELPVSIAQKKKSSR